MTQTTDGPKKDRGFADAIAETVYRYAETEPVGTVVVGLIAGMGLVGAILALTEQPFLAAFLVLSLGTVLLLVFSPRLRRLAFAPQGLAVLLAVTVLQGIASIVHTLLG